MMRLNAFTNGFHGWRSTTRIFAPRYVEWVYGERDFPGITIFEDGKMFEPGMGARDIRCHLRVGWLVEPRALRPENYTKAWERRDEFDYILTYDAELLRADPHKFVLAPRMGVHVPVDQWGMWPKSRNVAMIATQKRVTPGHMLRHAIARKYGHVVDVYGVNEWVDKIEALKPYRFAVVVESEQAEHLFTDHLLDVIALGCIPVYWGAPNIGAYLSKAGILTWHDLAERGGIGELTEGLYARMANAAQFNQALLPDYQLAEDWLYLNFFQHHAHERGRVLA